MTGPVPLANPLPPMLEGPRLELAVYTPREVDRVRAVVGSSRPHLSSFLGWAVTPASREDDLMRAVLGETTWREGRGAQYVISEAGTVRGMIGLHRRGGPDELEIGYWLAADATGRGLMTEACTVVTTAAFGAPEVHAVEITNDVRNHRSGAVAARLGFRRVGAFTSSTYTDQESGIKVRWRVERAAWAARIGSEDVDGS
jgi:RimJ/RimL family protein N-acetyltransferase